MFVYNRRHSRVCCVCRVYTPRSQIAVPVGVNIDTADAYVLLVTLVRGDVVVAQDNTPISGAAQETRSDKHR